MLKISEEVLLNWGRIRWWMRQEIREGSCRGWVNSGDGVIGWNWVTGYVGSGEMISDDVVYIMEYIGKLVGVGEFRGEEVEEGIRIRYYLSGGEELGGFGKDLLGAFYDLLYNAGEWYWENYCPSLVDVLGVREVGESGGDLWIYFEDFWGAREFMRSWWRFSLENRDDYGVEEVNHGCMRMMEGDFWIYSGRGVVEGFGGISGGILTVTNLGECYKN